MDTFKLYLAGKIVDVKEAKMTPDQMKKREKIAKSIERDNPDMPMDKKMAIATKTAMDEKASQGMFVVVQGSKYKVLGQFKDKKKAIDLMKKNPKSKTIQIGKSATVDGKPVDVKVGDEMSYTRFKLSTKIKEESNEVMNEGKMKDLAMKIDRVASNMRKDRMMKPFADKFKKDAMKSMNIRKSLEKVLPDYVAGKTLDKVMKEAMGASMHRMKMLDKMGLTKPKSRQMKNKDKEMMVTLPNKKGGVKTIDKKDWDKFKKKGYIQAESTEVNERNYREAFKVKDTVIPKVGPHKGVKHEIIHDFKDGTYNIKPIGLSSRQIKYRMGAAKAKKADLKSVKEAVEVNERNYRKEYDNYHSRPEQIANRSSRNSARRIMGDKAVKGMDVGHKDNNPLNNDPKNLQMEDPSENRREPRLRDMDEASKEGTIKIVKTKDNKFQVQRMTKGKFVNQGKPYKSLKDAEKVRSSGQQSMQFSHVEEKATDKRMRGWHKDYDFDQERDIVKGFVSPKAKSMAKKIVKDAIPMNKAIQKIRSKFPGMKMDAISDLLKKEGLPQALKAKDTARRKEYNAFQKARRK